MPHQLTFADSEFKNKRSKTRKEIFLARMNESMPWGRLEAIVEPLYPKAGEGRRPYPLSAMFRIHCMKHWYNMSDPAIEDALYEIAFMHLHVNSNHPSSNGIKIMTWGQSVAMIENSLEDLKIH
jgi:IS5 family transposase